MTTRDVLLTGGAGFVGSHTCKALHRAGYLPVTFDSLVRGNEEAVLWGPLVCADVRDRMALRAAIEFYAPVAVIHFAGLACVGESMARPASYYDNNVTGTLALLDSCLAAGLKTVIFSSSCATYGIPETLPIAETAAQRPINPYGRSKLACEQVIRDYAAAYGFRFAILRYFNACGADPDRELGEWHRPETHLIPRALMAGTGRLPYLEVFGRDHDTPDGTCVRDYIHVVDLAAAHCAALAKLEESAECLTLNLGTGHGSSVKDVLSAVEHHVGRSVAVRYRARRAGDPPALVADGSLAKRLLAFAPAYSHLDYIIATAAPFFCPAGEAV